MNNKKNKLDYSNWVPKKILILLWIFEAIAVALLLLDIILWKNTVLTIIFSILVAVLAFYLFFMHMMHHAFSFEGKALMGKIHEYLLSKLAWDGKGKLLDVGCGSGALTIRCAKKYPDAKVTGIDYWGIEWNYAKEQCENNAKIEGIKTAEFIKGDAANLSFEDETFDACVSNFVFHEVRTVKDKGSLVKEALRVVKKGGYFAFHDLFEHKNIYGDINVLIDELKKEGISEIHYEPKTENLPFVSAIIKPMFNGLGIIYGRK